ncbi:hypothetical protein AAG570_001090 [Ranatra chinensis]|uniref:RNA polymerase II-associated protein 1 N-terminal domain-containing protein n=1 Tax=Ranatra chinensis TaxID=642074 RepID=A0ABD0YBL0_9HEMI
MENVEKLTSMSSEELISERRRLFAEMDPGLIEFLKTRRTNQQHSCSQPALEKPSSMDTSEGTVHGDTTEVPAEVEELVNSYPNMDTVEPDKLKWIGEMPKPGPPPEDKPYNARFDFEGTLLAYADKGEGVLKGFHNHGEEQSRPGYTIQELIQLSRSSVLQQRVIALNTLAKILYNVSHH